MFQINEVENRNNAFPTIDFKFHNPGQTAAVLWQFSIEVLAAEIDPTPVLEFPFTVGAGRWGSQFGADDEEDENDLSISSVNRGWGKASECEVVLDEPTLNHFFPEDERRFNGSIESEEKKLILRLSPRGIPVDQFNEFHSHAMRSAAEEMERELPKFLEWNRHQTVENGYPPGALEQSYHKYQDRERKRFQWEWYMDRGRHNFRYGVLGEEVHGTTADRTPRIPIRSLKLNWRCKDLFGQVREGVRNAIGWPDGWNLYLSPQGFVYNEHIVLREALVSDVTYCTIIDPLLGAHERVYPISRVIPAGGAERFHILVGATKSAVLHLRFRFSVGKEAIVTSEEFVVHIWNPSGSDLAYRYKDGQHLKRMEQELESRSALNKAEMRELKHIKWDLRSASFGGRQPDDPFHDPERRIDPHWWE